MFCSKCGSEVKEGQEFCPSCGNSLNPNPNVAENDTTNDASEEVVNETPEEVVNETPEEVVNETPEEVTNEAQDEVTNETREEVVNETPDAEQNPTQDFTQNEASGVNPGFVPNQPFNMEPENKKKGFNKKLLIPIIGGIVVIAIVVAIILSCSKGGAEAKISEYFNAIKDGSSEKFAEASVPDTIEKLLVKELYDGDEDKVKEMYKKGLDDVEEEFDDDYSFDFDSDYTLEKVGSLKEKKIKKENEDSKEVTDKYGKEYMVEVTDGAVYKVKQKGAETFYVELKKENGNWYVVDTDDDYDEDKYDKE